MRRARVGLLVAVIAALGGCAVGPNYTRPPIVTPEAYKELDAWKVAQPGDLTLRGAWWETFGDPALNELESRVSAANQTLVAAEATYRQATALVREARAGFFPTVTIGAGYTRSQVSTTITSSGTNANATAAALTGGVATSTTGKPTNFFQLPIDVSWTPDLWAKIRRTVEPVVSGWGTAMVTSRRHSVDSRASLITDCSCTCIRPCICTGRKQHNR